MQDEWVVCKVFHKNTGMIKRSNTMTTELMSMNSFVEGLLDNTSLPPLMDSPYSNNTNGIVTNNEDDFKGTTITTTSTRSSGGNSFSYFPTNQIQIQQQQNNYMTNFNPTNYQTSTPSTNNYQIPNSIFYSPNGIPIPNANFPYQGSSTPLGYLHRQRVNNSLSSFSGLANYQQTAANQALERPLKVEQFSSNQSMVSRSQDTGLSTDLTAEISSKQEVDRSQQSYGDIDGRPNLVAPLSDLDSFWNY